MHCYYNILQVCLFCFFVFFCSWELLNCLALGKTQRLSLFTQPSNHWKRGRDKYYTDQSSYSGNNWTNREVNIAGLLHFYIQWYSSKWDARNTLLPWIFHIIATKAFSSATSWSFSEEHLAFFSWLKHVIEYILLGIWPISLFCNYAGAKPEKVDQNIPRHSWTRNLRSCNS